MPERVAILGAGGIGGVIGGYVVRSGCPVTLIDIWPENVESIRKNGLKVTGLEETFTVSCDVLHLGDVARQRERFDVVFLALKSYDTHWATDFIMPYLSPGGFLVSAQNGVNEDLIADVVGWSRVTGCVVTIGAAMYEPGHALRTSAADRKSFTVGEPSGLVSERIRYIQELLQAVGPTETTTNLWGERWAKLTTNCMSNAMAGVTGLKTAELRTVPEVLEWSIRIAREVIRVGMALGVNMEPIGGVPVTWFVDSETDQKQHEELKENLIESGKATGTGRPSLAQDLVKLRMTEVDFLNGYVVKRGMELGIAVPANESMVRLTKSVEQQKLEPAVSNTQYLNDAKAL